jgi:hypothetical protein
MARLASNQSLPLGSRSSTAPEAMSTMRLGDSGRGGACGLWSRRSFIPRGSGPADRLHREGLRPACQDGTAESAARVVLLSDWTVGAYLKLILGSARARELVTRLRDSMIHGGYMPRRAGAFYDGRSVMLVLAGNGRHAELQLRPALRHHSGLRGKDVGAGAHCGTARRSIPVWSYPLSGDASTVVLVKCCSRGGLRSGSDERRARVRLTGKGNPA